MVRVKHRYILVEIVTDRHKDKLQLPIKEGEIFREIRNAVEKLHGDYGVASVQAGLSIRMFNPATRVFVLRVRRGSHILVSSSLPFVTSFGRIKAILKTLHLSGTVRNCLKFLRHYDQRKLTELVKVLQLAPDSENMLTSISVDCYRKLDN